MSGLRKTRYIRIDEVIAILISVTLVLEFLYFAEQGVPWLQTRIERHQAIISNTDIFPYPYRVLVPYPMEALIQFATFVFPLEYRAAFLICYLLFELVAIFFMLLTLLRYLMHWFTLEHSLIGVLFVAATFSFTLWDYGFSPWSFLEVIFFTVGLSLIYRKGYRLLGVVIFLASLNRETGIFLVLAYAFTQIDIVKMLKREGAFPRKEILLSGLHFLLWLIPFVGLRLLLGQAESPYSVEFKLAKNMQPALLARTFISICLFLGFFWLFAIRGFKRAPSFIRRTTWILPAYLPIIIVYGAWYETRLFSPLYPIFIALGMSYLFRDEADETEP